MTREPVAPDDKARIVAEFDQLAAVYETNRLSGWYKAHGEEILSHIEPRTDGPVLDIGCGTGWLLRSLAFRQPKIQAVGVDLAPAMVQFAADAANDCDAHELHFLHDDWETMDLSTLPHAPFQTIVCASAFHYFANPQEAVNRMATVLRPGGRLLLLERDMTGSALTRLWDLLHRWIIRDHVTFGTASDLMQMLERGGFTNVQCLRSFRELLWKGKLYTNLVLISAERG